MVIDSCWLVLIGADKVESLFFEQNQVYKVCLECTFVVTYETLLVYESVSIWVNNNILVNE